MADHINFFNEDKNEGSGIRPGGIKHHQGKNQNASLVPQPGMDKLKPKLHGKFGSEIDIKEPLYNSRIIITYVEFLKKYHPTINIDSVLQFAGMTRHEVEDPGHWFNQHQTDRFHEIAVSQTGNPHIARDAGRFTVSCERVGPAKQYAMGLINLASVYLMVGKLARTMSRGAVMKAKKLGANRVEIISIPSSGTAEKRYQCENRIGTFESVARIFINKYAAIEHPECFHQGDKHCRYIATWAKTPSLIWKRISNFALIIGLLISLISCYTLPGTAWLTSASVGAIISLMLFCYAGRLEKKELVKTIETQGNAAKDLLEEMNIRHSNALLIQEIGQAVSRIPNVDRIVETVVEIMGKHLYFDRGMIMLTDPNGNRLKFIAGFGYSQEQEKILKISKFDLGNSQPEGHLVRCFKEQKPFLVNDVSEIEQDLSPKSREFIKQMAVQSFVCVPIVYEKEALGVLAVENTKLRRHLTQSEISVLMGVASQTAAGIINARSFKEIRKSEQQYRLLADNISDVIWTFDPAQSRFTYFSPSVARLLGFAPEEMLDLEMHDILTPDSYERAAKVIAGELAREKSEASDPYRSRTLELEQYRKDGTTLWSEVTASFLRDPSGKAFAILGAMRDISERKQAEQEKKNLETRLQQAHKMEAIGTLAGGIAHDFNNILAAVLGYTEMALNETPEGSLLRSNIQEVLSAGNRAKDLVKQILAFSRQAEQQLAPVKVKHVVTEALRLLRASLPSTVEIRRNIHSDAATLADPTQIHQVMMNLCANADHAMRDMGGILEVSLTDVSIDSTLKAQRLDLIPGDYLCLRVGDTGHGMPEEVKTRIFEPFYTTKGRDKGTGMGLSVVHGITKSHGGSITVKSEPGKGSTFEVFLPKIEMKTALTTDDNLALPTGDERILFVDDEKVLTDMGRQMLERLGYRVASRTSSIEALELFKAQPGNFDLVITDMTMPNMTGDKLAAALMAIRRDIPVILCTGFSEQITEEKAKKLGIREYILKPMVMNKLANTVRGVLDKGQHR